MTQIKKSFYAAVQENARTNFKKFFQTALEEKAEEYSFKAATTVPMTKVNFRIIPILCPEKEMTEFVLVIENMVNTLSKEARQQAKQETSDQNLGEHAEKALTLMSPQSFISEEKEVLTQWVEEKDLPVMMYDAYIVLFKRFFAATLYNKLMDNAKEHADDVLTSFFNAMKTEAIHDTKLAMAECVKNTSVKIFESCIFKQLMYTIKRVRDKFGDDELLREEFSQATLAFIANQH